MSEVNQYFKAFIVPSVTSSEVIAGRLSVDRWRLLFQAEGLDCEIPLEQLEIRPGRGNDTRVYFQDRRQPGVNIFAEDDSVLECVSFVQSSHVRRQLERIFGRRELLRRLRLTFYFFIGCGFAAWLCSLAAGVILRSLVNEIPMAWEIKMGNSLMEKEGQNCRL